MRVLQFQAAEDPGKRELRSGSHMLCARHNVTVAMPDIGPLGVLPVPPPADRLLPTEQGPPRDGAYGLCMRVFLNMLTIAIVLVTFGVRASYGLDLV